MRKLILIKHASPLVDPTKSSETWRLSEKGKASCEPLADALRAHELNVLVSSSEPKAQETAQILAEKLGVPTEPGADLFEHDRSNVPHMRSGEFISHMEVFFRRPGELLLGRESADDALSRFEAAVDEVLAGHSSGNIGIVSHGTVIALFVAEHSKRAGFELWRQMGLPSFVVMSLPGFEVETIADRIA